MSCTTPKILGFEKWFNRNFSDLCDIHDRDYTSQIISRKVSDTLLMIGIAERGYPTMAVLTYIYCRLLGWYFWYRRKYFTK